MTPLVWFGPIMAKDVKASVPDGFALHVVNCIGDVRPGFARCSELADRWYDRDERRLPGLRKRLGLAPDARPFLAAYSAGGQCVRRLLLDPRDRAELAGVYLADATYGAWASPGVVAVDALQEATVAMAVECARDGRPFVATTSAHVPGGGGPSGTEVLARLLAEIEAGLGRSLTRLDVDDAVLAGLPTSRAWRCGSVLLVDFGVAVPHVEHATKIAPALLPRVASGA